MPRSTLLRFGACIVAACMAGEASAQEAPTRPFQGLFGGNERDPNRRQALDLRASLQGAHDDNVLAGREPETPLDPRLQVRGLYSQYTLDMQYSLRSGGNAVQFGARASADLRHVPSVSAMSQPVYDAAIGIGLSKTKGIVSFQAQQRATYIPYRVLSTLPRAAPPGIENLAAGPGLDFAITNRSTYGSQSEAGAAIRMGGRSSWNVGYAGIVSGYAGTSEQFSDHTLTTGLGYRMSRYASLRLGYGHRMTSYSGTPGGAYVTSRNIDAGVDYNRALSFSRRTTISFGTGTSGASDGFDTRYFATGGATLTHDIGRSWHANAVFRRELTFVERISAPFISSGVTLAVGGYMSRRVDLVLTAGYADAVNGFARGSSSLVTYTGAARLRVALTRYGSAYAQYFHYQYRFDERNAVLLALPPSMERSGVRGGLTFWLPLLR